MKSPRSWPGRCGTGGRSGRSCPRSGRRWLRSGSRRGWRRPGCTGVCSWESSISGRCRALRGNASGGACAGCWYGWMRSIPGAPTRGVGAIWLDDPALAQTGDLLRTQAEASEDVVAVLAQLRATGADAARRAAEFGQYARHLERADAGLHLLDHLPRQVVRVLHDVSGGVGVTGGYAGTLERFDHFVAAALRGPLGNGTVDQLGVLTASVVVLQAWVIAQVVAADQAHQALVDAVAIAGDQHVAAVVARVGVGRRDAWQGAAGRLADVAEGVVLGDQAFHHGEYRLVQCHVDLLAFAAARTLLQGQQHADHAVQRGQRVADADAHAHRRLAGVAG